MLTTANALLTGAIPASAEDARLAQSDREFAWPGAANLECPLDGFDEIEDCGSDSDCMSCSCTPHVYNPSGCGQTWCGTAYAVGGVRDTDWYHVELADPDGDGVERVTATLTSEFPGVCFIVDGALECQHEVVAGGCSDHSQNIEVATIELPAPDVYFVFVAAGTCDQSGIFEGYPCGTLNDYTLTIECTGPCPEDFNGDGVADAADLAMILGNWGPCCGCPEDLNDDCVVDAADLALLLGSWGPCL